MKKPISLLLTLLLLANIAVFADENEASVYTVENFSMYFQGETLTSSPVLITGTNGDVTAFKMVSQGTDMCAMTVKTTENGLYLAFPGVCSDVFYAESASDLPLYGEAAFTQGPSGIFKLAQTGTIRDGFIAAIQSCVNFAFPDSAALTEQKIETFSVTADMLGQMLDVFMDELPCVDDVLRNGTMLLDDTNFTELLAAYEEQGIAVEPFAVCSFGPEGDTWSIGFDAGEVGFSIDLIGSGEDMTGTIFSLLCVEGDNTFIAYIDLDDDGSYHPTLRETIADDIYYEINCDVWHNMDELSFEIDTENAVDITTPEGLTLFNDDFELLQNDMATFVSDPDISSMLLMMFGNLPYEIFLTDPGEVLELGDLG